MTGTEEESIVFGLLGPNGAGKTTTIRLFLRLLEPSAGHARVLGYDTRTEADQIRQRTGALLEHSGLYERLRAQDHLEYYGRIWRMPPGERRARIEELLTHLGLWERRSETVNLAEAERLCALVGVIREGTLIAVGHPDELRSRRGGEQVTILGRGFDQRVLDILHARLEIAAADVRNGRLVIDLATAVSTAPLISVLVNAEAEVEEVRKDRASLEDVFLELMEEDDQ